MGDPRASARCPDRARGALRGGPGSGRRGAAGRRPAAPPRPEVALPRGTVQVALMALGSLRGPFEPGFGAAMLAAGPVGWHADSPLVPVGGGLFLARGARLAVADPNARSLDGVTARALLARASVVETWLPRIETLAIRLDPTGACGAAAPEIVVDGGRLGTRWRWRATRPTWLYPVGRQKAETLRLIIEGQQAYRVAGVVGLRGRPEEHARRLAGRFDGALVSAEPSAPRAPWPSACTWRKRTMVDPGHMNLYDRMDPPLRPGDYRLEVNTAVALATKGTSPSPPRAATCAWRGRVFPFYSRGCGHLSAEERGGHLRERPAPDRAGAAHAGVGARGGRRRARGGRPALAPPLPQGKPPWLALLIFSEAELPDEAVKRQVPLATGLARHRPADAGLSATDKAQKVDAIDVDASLLASILPDLDELQMLTHTREVNVDDRELSAGDSDGWFTVVIGNRLPSAGKWRAVSSRWRGATTSSTTSR
ncbi:MAG: hypothetical protein R3F43_19020 [bacterium]